jgi:hypothetical protein
MANRSIFANDTYPPILLQLSDETGVLNLSIATSTEVMFIGEEFEFSDPGVAIWPPQEDPDDVHFWNLQSNFATGDTENEDVYAIFVIVTWSTGNIQTFSTPDTLTIMKLPTA